MADQANVNAFDLCNTKDLSHSINPQQPDVEMEARYI